MFAKTSSKLIMSNDDFRYNFKWTNFHFHRYLQSVFFNEFNYYILHSLNIQPWKMNLPDLIFNSTIPQITLKTRSEYIVKFITSITNFTMKMSRFGSMSFALKLFRQIDGFDKSLSNCDTFLSDRHYLLYSGYFHQAAGWTFSIIILTQISDSQLLPFLSSFIGCSMSIS